MKKIRKIYSLDESIKRYEQIILLRKKGKNLREIGEIFGVSRQAIEIRIKRGVPKKSKSSMTHGLGKIFSGRDLVREQVRIRDNHTCIDCSKIWVKGNRRFDVHHLNGMCGKKSKGYDKVSEMDGLITLCHRCHYNRPEHRCQTESFRDSVRCGHSLTKSESTVLL